MKPGILLLGALIALGALVVPAAEQSDAIVQGQVVAAADRSALPGATVMLQTGAGGEPKQATTDAGAGSCSRRSLRSSTSSPSQSTDSSRARSL